MTIQPTLTAPAVVAFGRRVTMDVEIRTPEQPTGTDCQKARICYTHGDREIPETLEALLEGACEGEHRRVKLIPGQGYSPFDRPVSLALRKDRVPKSALRVGCQLRGETPSGREMSFHVREVRSQKVVVQSDDLPPGAVVMDVRVRKVDLLPEAALWSATPRPASWTSR